VSFGLVSEFHRVLVVRGGQTVDTRDVVSHMQTVLLERRIELGTSDERRQRAQVPCSPVAYLGACA
jgi:hypothetical protein